MTSDMARAEQAPGGGQSPLVEDAAAPAARDLTGDPADGFPVAEWPALALHPERLDRDMRRKRPPALSFLLRMVTARRLAAVLALLALDFLGVSLAIFTALVLKAVVLRLFGNGAPLKLGDEIHETGRFLPFTYLLTVLLFWRSGLYASRSQRPGLTRIVASLFQVAVVALIFAVVSGQHFRSFYVSWGSLLFGLIYVPLLRHLYERVTGVILRAAGYRRLAVLVGTGTQIVEVAHALRDTARTGATRTPVEVVGY